MTYMLDIAALRKAAVDAVDSLVADVVDHLANGDVADIDERVRGSLGDLGEQVVGQIYEQVATARRAAEQRGQTPDCPRCGGRTRFKQSRPIVVRTVLTGRGVRVFSPYSMCDSCRVGVHGLRRELGLDVTHQRSRGALPCPT